MNSEDENDSDAEAAPAFAADTWADKGIRFGCGFLLATLVVASVAIYVGVGTVSGAIVVWVIVAASCGILAAVGGEGILKRLLRLMRWL